MAEQSLHLQVLQDGRRKTGVTTAARRAVVEQVQTAAAFGQSYPAPLVFTCRRFRGRRHKGRSTEPRLFTS
jgi:hypothetical protein